MRQILVKENSVLKTISGDHLELTIGEFNNHVDLELTQGVNLLRAKLALSVVSGGYFKLQFQLGQTAARLGVVLHGAYWENDEVVVAVTPTTLPTVLSAQSVLVIGNIYETAKFRQVKELMPRKERKAPKKR
jgi:hypothetical protein